MPEVAIALIVSILTVAIVFARFNLLIFNKYFCNSPFNPGFLISLINSSRNCSTSWLYDEYNQGLNSIILILLFLRFCLVKFNKDVFPLPHSPISPITKQSLFSSSSKWFLIFSDKLWAKFALFNPFLSSSIVFIGLSTLNIYSPNWKHDFKTFTFSMFYFLSYVWFFKVFYSITSI